LADFYARNEDFILAAQALAGIPLDSAGRQLSTEYKVNIYVRIAQYYLEEEESVQAEIYIKRAAQFTQDVKDPQLLLRFKSCLARIQDHKRLFLEAALKYHELSQIVSEGERLDALKLAVTCAILAKAGPQRSRVLANLYKDDRSAKLDIFSVLEKMYLERVIRKSEVQLFKEGLAVHQMADLSDGYKVHEKAIIEHNLLAASKIYLNITFDELGGLLEISPQQAEKVAARMIVEERLKGTIDQVDRLLYFQTSTDTHQLWDTRIEAACSTVNAVMEVLSKKYPSYVKST